MIEVTLVLSDIGKRNLASSLIGKDDITGEQFECFNVRWFEVGEGGVEGDNILAPDPTRVDLVSPIEESLQEVKSARINEFNCPKWTCEVGPGIAGNLSEIGLWARKIKSINNGNIEYDTISAPFLFAYGTFGARNKGAAETEIFEISVQF